MLTEHLIFFKWLLTGYFRQWPTSIHFSLFLPLKWIRRNPLSATWSWIFPRVSVMLLSVCPYTGLISLLVNTLPLDSLVKSPPWFPTSKSSCQECTSICDEEMKSYTFSVLALISSRKIKRCRRQYSKYLRDKNVNKERYRNLLPRKVYNPGLRC